MPFLSSHLWLPFLRITGWEAAQADFTDISKSFAKNDIVALYNKQVIVGTGAGLFRALHTVTRAEFVKMLAGVLAWNKSSIRFPYLMM